MNVRILSNNTQSIARRLALMFALAAAAVFSVTGYALYQYQCVELRRHQLQEIKTRFEFVENLIVRRISNPEKWALLEEKMTELMPQDGSIVYLVESTDPRYRLGKSFAADAKVSNEGNGVRRIVTANGTYLTLSGEIPAGGQRPAVLLTVGLDSSAFDTTSRAINAALLTAFLFGVLVVAVLGWWIARRGLAAVDELSKHAAKLSPLNLAERLPASDLPNELNGLAHSFNGALERVEQAYVQLSTFNSDVAHELRTPLGNLIGQTQVMLSRERSAEELTDVLQSNLEELERLRTIINDMLFLAQADRGIRAANLELLSIAAEVLKSAEFLDMLMEEADVSLVLEGDAEACIDRSCLGARLPICCTTRFSIVSVIRRYAYKSRRIAIMRLRSRSATAAARWQPIIWIACSSVSIGSIRRVATVAAATVLAWRSSRRLPICMAGRYLPPVMRMSPA